MIQWCETVIGELQHKIDNKKTIILTGQVTFNFKFDTTMQAKALVNVRANKYCLIECAELCRTGLLNLLVHITDDIVLKIDCVELMHWKPCRHSDYKIDNIELVFRSDDDKLQANGCLINHERRS